MCWIGNGCQDFEGLVNWTTEVAEFTTGDSAAVETEVTTGESININGDFSNQEIVVKNDKPVMAVKTESMVSSSEDNTTEEMLTTEKDIISTVRPTEAVTELDNSQSTTLDEDIELSEALPTAKQRSGDLEAWHKLRHLEHLHAAFYRRLIAGENMIPLIALFLLYGVTK